MSADRAREQGPVVRDSHRTSAGLRYQCRPTLPRALFGVQLATIANGLFLLLAGDTLFRGPFRVKEFSQESLNGAQCDLGA